MNYSRIILFYLASFFWFSCANKVSTEDMAEAPAMETDALLAQEFTANDLDPGQLDVFEIRARQKIKDLLNYTAIISDPDLDKAMRKQAMDMSLQCFISNNAPMSSLTEPRGTIARKYYRKLYQSEGPKVETQAEEVRITNKLQYSDEGGYRGKLTFMLITKITLADSVVSSRSEREVTFWVKKIPKAFGDDNRRVWEVLIGEMRTTE